MISKKINDISIYECTREEMIKQNGQPYFGFSIPKLKIVYMRMDIPSAVYESVLAHEMQHIKDNAFSDGQVWHWEFRAWVAGFRGNWRGFLQAVWLSLTDWERIKLYLLRITKTF